MSVIGIGGSLGYMGIPAANSTSPRRHPGVSEIGRFLRKRRVRTRGPSQTRTARRSVPTWDRTRRLIGLHRGFLLQTRPHPRASEVGRFLRKRRVGGDGPLGDRSLPSSRVGTRGPLGDRSLPGSRVGIGGLNAGEVAVVQRGSSRSGDSIGQSPCCLCLLRQALQCAHVRPAWGAFLGLGSRAEVLTVAQ